MEIFNSTAKLQQSMTSIPKTAAPELQNVQMQKVQIIQDKASQADTEQKTSKVDSQEQMDNLVEQLNRSLNPFNTNIRFGFDDSSKDFYVSVIDTKSNELLRRFPREQAEALLPKIQEVNGLLFDQKG